MSELLPKRSVVFADTAPWRRFARFMQQRLDRDARRVVPRYMDSDRDLGQRVMETYDAFVLGQSVPTDELETILEELAGWLYGEPGPRAQALHALVLKQIKFYRRAGEALTEQRREILLNALTPEARKQWDDLVKHFRGE